MGHIDMFINRQNTYTTLIYSKVFKYTFFKHIYIFQGEAKSLTESFHEVSSSTTVNACYGTNGQLDLVVMSNG